MNCSTFEDHLSDYLEAALDSRTKAECAAHRLVCRECRALYNEVRATMTAVGELAEAADSAPAPMLTTRILAATTPGQMLSCREFDQLIELYFDGVLLAPAFQTFQGHFDQCRQCHRLLVGIEDAVSLCREAKQEVAIPADLPARIVAVTTGQSRTNRLFAFLLAAWTACAAPQWAAALLILAAALTLVSARFATVNEFKTEAHESATRWRQGWQANGQQARSQLKMATVRFEALLDLSEQPAPSRQQATPPLNTYPPPCNPNQLNITALPVSNPPTSAAHPR